MANFRFRVAQLLCSTVGFAILAAAVSPAHAEGRVFNARITELSVTGTLAWVSFNVNVAGTRPSCITPGWENVFMFDPTADRGKAFLAHLEIAMSAGKRVEAFGAANNTCVGDAEAIGYVKIFAN